MAGLADKTIGNMEELIAANKALGNPETRGQVPRTEYQKQRLTIEASLSRCRRCGDFAPAFPVAAPLAIICADCEKELKTEDVMWFADMVAAVSKKGKGS